MLGRSKVATTLDSWHVPANMDSSEWIIDSSKDSPRLRIDKKNVTDVTLRIYNDVTIETLW